MPESVYTIHNVAKSASTKVRRYYQPGRARQKQFLGGYRMLHNQHLRLSPEEFKKHEESILERVRRGIFHVSTPDGTLIFADQFGNLKTRKGQDIQDLVAKIEMVPEPKPAPLKVPDVVEEELKELEAEVSPPQLVEVMPAAPPPVEAQTDEPDFSNAYTQVAEKKSDSTSSKKGKRR